MAAAVTNYQLPDDTSEPAKEALALLGSFFTAWRDGDPEGMLARIADGQVDYVDYWTSNPLIKFLLDCPLFSPLWMSMLVDCSSGPYADRHIRTHSVKAIQPFMTVFFHTATDFTYTTVAAYGDRCQLTLEAVISFTLQAELPGFPLKKGDTATLPGVSIFKMDEEGLAIFKHDHFFAVAWAVKLEGDTTAVTGWGG